MGITVLLGVAVAVIWGLPDVALSRATKSVGIVGTVIGSIAIGLALTLPLAFFAGVPDVSPRGALLVVGMGALTLLGYLVGFSAFKVGKVSVVAPTHWPISAGSSWSTPLDSARMVRSASVADRDWSPSAASRLTRS